MRAIAISLLLYGFLLLHNAATAQQVGKLKVSDNGHFFETASGKPFFYMGETGWLLFTKLTREEANTYLENRRQKGFNVIQVMLLHTLEAVNVYGDSALVNKNVATPKITKGLNYEDPEQYDYWDHVDYIVQLAARKGIYMAMVPVWGSAVKSGVMNDEAAKYASFLADRYKNEPNIIWLDGGDINPTERMDVWETIGETLKAKDGNHLIGFHPRGRTQSSKWFQKSDWLDFNCFQSGHRNYAQDTSAGDLNYGEDNWRYVQTDYVLLPSKPTIDAEPSYEGIPHGLHDFTQPLWTASDVRRYGYWSVFAGAAGFTYGHNAVMQMFKPTEKEGAYGNKQPWYEAINAPGAGQMQYLEKLMLSQPYFERVPDQSLLAENGEKYDYKMATRGEAYAFVYTYNGSDIKLVMGKIVGKKVKASWYDPRTGQSKSIGAFANKGVRTFDPPGEKADGNDWVLVLESM